MGRKGAAEPVGPVAPRTDRQLLAACQAGDETAWEELIRRYRRLIYSIPHACRLAPEQADDVFGRVALVLFENLPRLRDPDKLASWLVITTRRECWALSRESRRSRGFEDGEAEAVAEEAPDIAADLHRVECEHALTLAFERLGEPCHGLLHALYVEEPTPSYEEVGRRLGRPVGALGPTRARCLAKLQKLYVAQGGGNPFEREPTGEC